MNVNFSDISVKKGYKLQKAKKTCTQCSKEINQDEDHFMLQLNWKIKNNPDYRTFCSLKCLGKWVKS